MVIDLCSPTVSLSTVKAVDLASNSCEVADFQRLQTVSRDWCSCFELIPLEIELRHIDTRTQVISRAPTPTNLRTKNTISGTRCWAFVYTRKKPKDPAVPRRRALMQVGPLVSLRHGHLLCMTRGCHSSSHGGLKEHGDVAVLEVIHQPLNASCLQQIVSPG